MIECFECGAQVSDSAWTCPTCGTHAFTADKAELAEKLEKALNPAEPGNRAFPDPGKDDRGRTIGILGNSTDYPDGLMASLVTWYWIMRAIAIVFIGFALTFGIIVALDSL